MRREPPQQRHLARIEIWTASFPDEVHPTPLPLAHRTDRQRLISQAQGASEFAAAEGALDFTSRHIRKPHNRNAIPDHLPLLIPVLLEVDLLQIGAVRLLAKHLRSKHPGQETTDRVIDLGAISLKGRYPPDARRHGAQQG